MRRIGTHQDGSVARRFCDYLLTLDIDATVDNDDGGPDSEWDIWIRDEENVERARSEWIQFQQDPEAPHYEVKQQAAAIRDQRVADQLRRVETHRKPPPTSDEEGVKRGEVAPSRAATASDSKTRRWGSGKPGPAGGPSQPSVARPPRPKQQAIPVTIAIIVISVIASLTSHFSNPRGTRDPNRTTLEQRTYDTLSFVDRRDYAMEGDAFASIKKGQWWRFVTPMFLHGDEFHLAFNMLWVFFLGSAIERLHGSWFLLAVILITQTAGMMLQVLLPDTPMIPEPLRGSPFAIGASGAVYGLFGFLWIRPYVQPSYPIHLVPMNVALMLGWLVICLTPIANNVANGAHLGGLFSGILIAVAGPMIRR